MKNEVISILMPVYNTAQFIDECIQSIIAQTYLNWELIAVDDFSTDNSYSILTKYSQQDARIKVLKNEYKGILPALEKAFKHAKGNYITRMDSDDLMPEDKLKQMSAYFPLPNKTVLTGKVKYFSTHQPVSKGYFRYENWLNDLVDEQEHWKYIYRECVIASPNWLVHRSCFEKDFSFSSLNYPEDYDMVFQWHKNDYVIESIPKVTHLWREHPKRTSRHHEAYQQAAFFDLKLRYFLENECHAKTIIQLVGAQQKGKLTARLLKKHHQPFIWFDHHANQFNQGVYGKKIYSVDQLKANQPTILTVWPQEKKLQEQITYFLKGKKLVFGDYCHLF